MKLLYRFLVETKNVERASFLWNMIAYTSNSFQSMVLLLLITRRGDLEGAAIFSIAFTVASMLSYIGKYSVRPYQVSDVKREYTYGEYVSMRKKTVLAMLLATIVYLIYCWLYKDYSLYKTACVLLMVGYRLLESAEDVFHGDLQLNQRLDIASKIWALRTLTYIVSFIALYWMTKNILVALTGSLLISILLFFFLNHLVSDIFPRKIACQKKNVVRLLKACFPIAVSTFIMVYISNSPKYAVDAVLTSEEQACFNIVFMPVFVITLLGSYIYNPLVSRMANFWREGKKEELRQLLLQKIMIIILFSAIVIVGGGLLGIRILELLYKVALKRYEWEFVFLMVAGGLLAVFNFLVVIATVMRKQKILLYISVISALAFAIGNKRMLMLAGVRGMCEYYAAVMAIMTIITLILVSSNLKHCKLE